MSFEIDLTQVFECGQCFRFSPYKNGYHGVAYGKYIEVFVENGKVVSNVDDDFITDFLDLKRDYAAIGNALSEDIVIKNALEYSSGIRILKQDPWETLCSFIISQNNNIPRIKKIIASLCDNYGDEIEGTDMKSFPSAQKVAALTKEEIDVIRSGFRGKYISDAATRVANGEINLDTVRKMCYYDAKRELKKIKGVGDKVADCVLLFGLGFYEAFPIDVWVKRVLEKYYSDPEKPFSPEKFGKYAGIAQQYLFYYERSINKK